MTASGSLPRAAISRSALERSARSVADAGGRVADLRADAFGHGVHETARVVHSAGIPRVIVDDEAIASSLRSEGIDAVTRGVSDIDSVVLYGLSGTIPVMSLTGRMLSRKSLRAGEAVSYGYTHRAQQDTTIALVTGGYAQGIVRALGNNAQVGVGDELRPIIGRVAMDVCVVDLQSTESPIDTDVVYFGAGPASGELSAWARVTGLRVTELAAVAGAKAARRWTN